MQIYRHCRDMMDAASGAVDAASLLTAQPRGRVSIGAPISIAKSLIHPRIPGFLSTSDVISPEVSK
ncbi:LysR family transcriptional regulator [Burkholderia contaminans]|nr:LysR family transcriptional regulator [Burkholderia contaminans]